MIMMNSIDIQLPLERKTVTRITKIMLSIISITIVACVGFAIGIAIGFVINVFLKMDANFLYCITGTISAMLCLTAIAIDEKWIRISYKTTKL
jgi:hypothetical protein